MMEYIDWKMDQRVDSSAKAREYLMKQIDRAKINLEEAEEKAAPVRAAGRDRVHGFPVKQRVPAARGHHRRLGQAEADLILEGTLYEQAVEDGPESLPQVLNSPMINSLKTEYAKLRSDYESLTEIFHEDYPDVKLSEPDDQHRAAHRR
jgi:hypothetical protein